VRLAQAQVQIGFLAEAIATLRVGMENFDASGVSQARMAELNMLYQQMALAHQIAGDDVAMVKTVREAMSRRVADPQMLLLLADALATTPHDEVRNPAEAQQIAERLLPSLSETHKPFALRALAAAHAAQGDFERARATARQALQMAQAQNNQALVREMTLRLEKYEANLPFRRGE
jgi:ATP/maltotriose-dependent transcriptional regulator MalT